MPNIKTFYLAILGARIFLLPIARGALQPLLLGD